MNTNEKAPATVVPVTQGVISFESTGEDTKNNLKSQNLKILSLLKYRPLTALDALHLADCWSLSQRVYNLRCDGHQIITNMIKLPSGKRVAQYILLTK